MSFRTVLRWIERGELKAYKLPGRGDHRITIEDFMEFLSRNSIPVPAGLRGRTRRVLVVEDEQAMSLFLSEALKDAGYEVQTAVDGLEAGAQLVSFQPDVVTLDLHMKGLSGHRVIELIRSRPALKRMQILVISGMPIEEIDSALREGADDALQKPIELPALLERVGKLAAKSRSAVYRRATG